MYCTTVPGSAVGGTTAPGPVATERYTWLPSSPTSVSFTGTDPRSFHFS